MRKRLETTVVMFFITAVMFISACDRKPPMSHAQFVDLPSNGWQQSMPLTFLPEYDDSTLTYDISLAIRHNNCYRYRNLVLMVDLISSDSTVSRQKVDIPIADGYGNWTGGGFGTLYQSSVSIAKSVKPIDASSIVVWQALKDCDTLVGLVNVGVIVSPK